jgi:LysM repeat protein
MFKNPRLFVWVVGVIAILMMVMVSVSPAQAQATSGNFTSGANCDTPTAPKGFGYYVVRKGETLQSIASSFGIPAATIQALNGGATFTKGSVILLPSVEAPGKWNVQQVCNTTATIPSLGQASVSLPAIPVTGGVSQTTVLSPIQTCTAPTAPKGFGYYVVRKGDSLQSISNNFGVPVSTILSLNSGKSFTRHELILLPATEAPGMWDTGLFCP